MVQDHGLWTILDESVRGLLERGHEQADDEAHDRVQ
jgi:hypothetical protein